MEKMNVPSLEGINEIGIENSPEFKKLTEIVGEFKDILKGNAENKKVTQLSRYVEMAGL